MKHLCSLIIPIVCIILSGCSTKLTVLKNGNYYAILPDNFINHWRVRNDTIVISTLNQTFQARGGRNDTSLVIIHKITKEGNIYNLCVEQPDGNNLGKSRFNILAITKDGRNIFYTSTLFDGKYYKTLKECEQQSFFNPEDNFCFSLYTQREVDSFRHFKNIKEVDTQTVCKMTQNLKANVQIYKDKLEKIAKYDMYLSGSTKELVNRTLIEMEINPIDYTGYELNEAFKKCNDIPQ